MIVIDDIIVSDGVVDKHFVCDLNRCKGACCIEGDGGAPLDDDELSMLDKYYAQVEPYLQQKGIDAIHRKGRYVYERDDEYSGYATPLMDDSEACAYVTENEHGIAVCGIEQAFEDDVISFRKPVSCHLYPIRVTQYEKITAVNYETWDICSSACQLGKELKVPAYQFIKDGLIRKFGSEFYEQLQGAAKYKNENE